MSVMGEDIVAGEAEMVNLGALSQVPRPSLTSDERAGSRPKSNGLEKFGPVFGLAGGEESRDFKA